MAGIVLRRIRGVVVSMALWRFALWGALATFGVVWLMVAHPAVAAAAAIPGAAAAAGALLLARRASSSPDEPADSSPPAR